MATLLLTTVGTLIGGPIGGAIGAFAGQQIDGAIFGGGSYEGPRLKDLAVTTSSYGQPLAKHYGTMRVAGTVIWATELKESRETDGGGKGKPKTTTYSYSASFAVALSGRPIHDVGRIWADGDLLRGAAGDLKTGGTIRTYTGKEDQSVDPLLAAAEGASCPAFRDCAYVVFEDLELGDFGNRIPALTFEIQADPTPQVDLAQILQSEESDASPIVLPNLLGFSNEGGELASTLQVLDQLFPLHCSDANGHPVCTLQSSQQQSPFGLTSPLAWIDEEHGQAARNFEKHRARGARPQPRALRYYDRDRDYQPGVQRSEGAPAAGREVMLQFPGALSANDARALCSNASQRARWTVETVTWRVAQVDTDLAPGRIVQLEDQPGYWTITQWEWLERGVELKLQRLMSGAGLAIEGDSGGDNPPADLTIPPTILHAFELPWDGTGSAHDPQLFTAASAASDGWRGAFLYIEQAGGLVGLGPANGRRAIIGSLATALPPSTATHLERSATLELDLAGTDLTLEDTTIAGMAAGANRILVGSEVIQFLCADQISDTRWRLSGLLRGRGGTETLAAHQHEQSTRVVVLDDRITALDPASIPSPATATLAAIGLADSDPVTSSIAAAGISRQPLAPVHTRHTWQANGDLSLCWTRRARGQWQWNDYVDTPQVEEKLRFAVGFGPAGSPVEEWEVAEPQFTLDALTIADLLAVHGAGELHVAQIGTYGRSPSTLITNLS